MTRDTFLGVIYFEVNHTFDVTVSPAINSTKFLGLSYDSDTDNEIAFEMLYLKCSSRMWFWIENLHDLIVSSCTEEKSIPADDVQVMSVIVSNKIRLHCCHISASIICVPPLLYITLCIKHFPNSICLQSWELSWMRACSGEKKIVQPSKEHNPWSWSAASSEILQCLQPIACEFYFAVLPSQSRKLCNPWYGSYKKPFLLFVSNNGTMFFPVWTLW